MPARWLAEAGTWVGCQYRQRVGSMGRALGWLARLPVGSWHAGKKTSRIGSKVLAECAGTCQTGHCYYRGTEEVAL